MPDKVTFTFGADTAEFKAGLDAMKEQLNDLAEAQRQSAKATGSMAAALGSIKGVMAGAVGLWGLRQLKDGMVSFYESVVSGAAEAEKSAVAFEVLMGNAAAAKAQVEALKDYAAATPFAFDDIAEADKTLLSFGVEAEKSQEVLRQLGDIAAVSGASLGELADVYGKMAVTGVDMKGINQLASRGVNVIGALAQLKGISPAEVAKLIGGKQITLADIDAVLAQQTGAGGRFEGGTQKLSQTLEGKISTLKDNVDAVKNAFGEGFVGALKGPIDELTAWIASNKDTLRHMGQSFADGMAYALKHAKEIAAVLAGVGTAVSVYRFAKALPDIKEALLTMRGLLVAMMVPFKLLAGAVAGVTAATAAIVAAIAAAGAAMLLLAKKLHDSNQLVIRQADESVRKLANGMSSPAEALMQEARGKLTEETEEADSLEERIRRAAAAGDTAALRGLEDDARFSATLLREKQNRYIQDGGTRAGALALLQAERELENRFLELAEAARKPVQAQEEADALAAAARAEEERKLRERRAEEYARRKAEEMPGVDAAYRRAAHAATPAERLAAYRSAAAKLGVPNKGDRAQDLLGAAREERDKRGMAGEDIRALDKLVSALESFTDHLVTLGETQKQTLMQHRLQLETSALEQQGQSHAADALRESYTYMERTAALMQQGFSRAEAERMAQDEALANYSARMRQQQDRMPTVFAASGVSVGNGGGYIRLGGQQLSVSQRQLTEAQNTNRFLETLRSTVEQIRWQMDLTSLPVI